MIYKSLAYQRQMIGYFRKLLKINEDIYYDILATYNVASSKDLTYSQAKELIENLKAKAVETGVYIPRTSIYKTKYDNMSGRLGMGTPKQLRKIDVMWKSVSNQQTNVNKEKALNKFLFKITGKERLQFLTQSEISKVIKALTMMQKKAGCLYD